jgi:hypothetical protein
MVVIRAYKDEYGSVFPSYETIAELGGMSKRKAIYVVKELVEWGLVDKEARFREVGGESKQSTNEYREHAQDAIEDEKEDAQDATPSAQYAPYNSSTYIKTYDDEDNNIKHTVEFPHYAAVEKQMAADNNGVPTFKDVEFLQVCTEYKLPKFIVKLLYEGVKDVLGIYHVDAIRSTVEKFVFNFSRNRIKAPVKWFLSTFFNENICIRGKGFLTLNEIV